MFLILLYHTCHLKKSSKYENILDKIQFYLNRRRREMNVNEQNNFNYNENRKLDMNL